MTTDKQQRKEIPIFRGALMYFPDAIAAVANCSYVANQQHNPGEEMHWDREKSKDHEDCIVRHLLERGKIDTDGIRHSAKVAWRALAMLQLEIETELSVSKNATPKPGENTQRWQHVDGLIYRKGALGWSEYQSSDGSWWTSDNYQNHHLDSLPMFKEVK